MIDQIHIRTYEVRRTYAGNMWFLEATQQRLSITALPIYLQYSVSGQTLDDGSLATRGSRQPPGRQPAPRGSRGSLAPPWNKIRSFVEHPMPS